MTISQHKVGTCTIDNHVVGISKNIGFCHKESIGIGWNQCKTSTCETCSIN